ncbi:beta-ketoacyl synthase chain length factor [Vreelandella subglaciescola]|uniref:Beta-ketoacyl synthase, N-terminal domain n=1 Tax=Vreelandella subglaciescola TaxID=29571 RepID=A0A1M7I812_9GAMM|nr:beta-ketoacyl synthase chain length factor [Halomonas subglaciescola]SHM36788.1 Beta-ketoacyl synthase, N-terminal domain [Halomonas subglaciescola]
MDRLHISDWRAWCASGTQRLADPQHSIPSPVGSSLPGMLRRRLDATGRATCDILHGLTPAEGCPLIHASRHGDVVHTLSMLEALAQQAPLSPTRFSMSVHNAVLGVYSIAHNHRLPLQALGACGHEFDALLTEAGGYLDAGYESVVVVFSEGELPATYQGHTPHPGHACAVGLRLSRRPDAGPRLTATRTATPGEPTPQDIIAWLTGDAPWLDGLQRFTQVAE